MTEFGELTLEQKFRLETLRAEVFALPTDILMDTIVQEYIKIIQMDNVYKKLIKENWGIGNGTK